MDDVIRAKLRDRLGRSDRENLLGGSATTLAEVVRENLGPGHKREAGYLNAVMQAGVPARLLSMPAAGLTQSMVANYAKQISDETGLREDIARWAIEAWAFGLGLQIVSGEFSEGRRARKTHRRCGEWGHWGRPRYIGRPLETRFGPIVPDLIFIERARAARIRRCADRAELHSDIRLSLSCRLIGGATAYYIGSLLSPFQCCRLVSFCRSHKHFRNVPGHLINPASNLGSSMGDHRVRRSRRAEFDAGSTRI